MNGTLFGRSLWDCGSRVIAVRLDEYPIRRCIHEQEKLQRDEDQGELNLDSTQRPLQGAFLIPSVLPVVLIRVWDKNRFRCPRKRKDHSRLGW
jgi:hypothetical protein